MDGATDHRGLSERHRAEVAVAGSRLHLRGRVPAPCRRHGHHRGRLESVESLAESICGETDRIDTARVSGSRHRPQRTIFAARAHALSFLLSCVANTSVAGQRRTDITTDPAHDGRFGNRVRGSWWIAPSIRATRCLTQAGCVARGRCLGKYRWRGACTGVMPPRRWIR